MLQRGATEVAVERRGTVHIHASIRSVLIALAAATSLALTPAPAAAAESPGTEYGLGVGCAFINLVYGPVKVLYATGGAIVSGFAWVFSAGDTDVSRPIWDASMRGDYMIVPDQLRGRRGLDFIGRAPEQAAATGTPWKEESSDDGF
jgi:type IV secretory pathway VirB2 component (pilin)